MIDILRKELSCLQSECGKKVHGMKDVTITIRPEQTSCPNCIEEMGVKRSYKRNIITERYGNVSARVITLE
ncbi:MAG: hypothetical protein H8D23_03570 [Candidatus Brocadiales bacterium]|nr:hypothetical protein [Candidatus Brocadiales bacterium]